MCKTKGNLFKATFWYEQQYLTYVMLFCESKEKARIIARNTAESMGLYVDRITITTVSPSKVPW